MVADAQFVSGRCVEQSKEEIEWEELAVKFDKISPESDELAYDQETDSVKNIALKWRQYGMQPAWEISNRESRSMEY